MYISGIRDFPLETMLSKEGVLAQERLLHCSTLGPSVNLEENLYVLQYFKSY